MLKPLNLALLRKFMSKIKEWSEIDDDADKSFDVLMQAGSICFAKIRPEFYDKAGQTYTENFEEVMDLQTLYKALDVCGGVKLDDPKLMEMAQEMIMKDGMEST
jgi:hypothetical protein